MRVRTIYGPGQVVGFKYMKGFAMKSLKHWVRFVPGLLFRLSGFTIISLSFTWLVTGDVDFFLFERNRAQYRYMGYAVQICAVQSGCMRHSVVTCGTVRLYAVQSSYMR